jgi:hypothetical protein
MGRWVAESLLSTHWLGAPKPAVVEPLESYLKRYDINQLAIDKIEYDMTMQGNYLERLSLFNPEVREFLFSVSKRAYDDAVKIRDAYLSQEDK